MTAALRQGEQATTIRVEPLNIDGKTRRAKPYPDDARLRWA